jgi:hypothetical protein
MHRRSLSEAPPSSLKSHGPSLASVARAGLLVPSLRAPRLST